MISPPDEGGLVAAGARVDVEQVGPRVGECRRIPGALRRVHGAARVHQGIDQTLAFGLGQ